MSPLDDLARGFEALADPAAETPIDARDDLTRAARRVARAQGFDIESAPRPGASVEDSVRALARAARSRARRVDLVGSWWVGGGPPLVAFLREDGSAVALLADERGGYAVEARDGTRRRVDAANQGEVAPEAWALLRPLPEGATSLPGLLAFSLTGRGGDLWRAGAWGAAITLVGLAAPAATGWLVDTLIPDADRNGLLILGAALLALAGGATTFQLAQSTALLRLDVSVESAAQSALWDRLLRLEPSFFRRYPAGELLERVNAASAVGRRLTGLTLKTVLQSALAVLNAAALYLYSPRLAGVAAVAALLVVTATTVPAIATAQHARRTIALRGRLFGALVGLLEGVGKLRSAGAEERGFTHWARLYRRQLEAQTKAWHHNDRAALASVALPSLAMLALYASAGGALEGGAGEALSAGAFLAFHGTFGQFLGALAALSGAALDVVHVRAEAERARPILEAPTEVASGSIDPGPLAGAIALDRVTFRYRPDGPPVLDRLSLSIAPGEYVAIVGASGCGKSTLLRILLGFETPESGRVAFDGQDLRGLDREAVRRQIGVVLQSGRLMPGSLFENVAGAKPIGLEEAWKALALAGLDEEVRAMPMGLHTVIGAEGTLSGGQRQRLLIARALVGEPKILLFDEATSALDNRSQALVSENIARQGRTRIAIAHRLSTVRAADRVVVLQAGRVAEEGTFDALMESRGLFWEMAQRQIG